jgi:two-component system LytT family response regulator/two-component system response regulator LytT
LRHIRAVIADDEHPARDELRYLLGSLGGVEVVGEAVTAAEAVALCARLEPDVVFLDIAMPGGNGIEVARDLRRRSRCPRFVFVTAYEEYAVQAFEVSAVDYLLKPFSKERLSSTLDNLRRSLHGDESMHEKIDLLLAEMMTRFPNVKVPAERNGSIVLVDAADIVYAESVEGRVRLRTYDKEFFTRLSLSHLQARLGKRFLRVHRAFLVNLDKVSEVIPWFSGTYTLAVKDKGGSRVPVARAQVREMKDALGI